MSKFCILSLLSILLFQCKSPSAHSAHQEQLELTTFILVRHSEKEKGQDPSLSQAGIERTQRLAEMLSQVSIDHVYSSDYNRTRETAQPVADRHQLSVWLYDPRELSAFAEELIRKHPGETVLIVGHSNSTPTLTNLLAPGSEYPAFDESDYGNLVFVHHTQASKPKVQLLRF